MTALNQAEMARREAFKKAERRTAQQRITEHPALAAQRTIDGSTITVKVALEKHHAHQNKMAALEKDKA